MLRRGLRSRPAVCLAAAAAVVSLGWSPGIAQEAFPLNADGSAANNPNPRVYQWITAPWTGPVAEHPGLDDADDDATIAFREFNNADQSGDAHVDIDLRVESTPGSGVFDTPGTFTLNQLSFGESGTGNTDGDFQNGTLNLNAIDYTGGGREVDFESTITLNGNGGALSVDNSGASSIDFIGAVNAPTSFTYTGTSSFIRVSRTTNASFGATTLANTAGAFVIANYDSTNAGVTSGLDTFTVDSLNANGAGKLELDRVTGTLPFKFNVTGATAVNNARLRLDANDDDATLNLNGLVTVDNNGNGVEIGTEDRRAVINLNAGLADGGDGDVLTLIGHGATSSTNLFGTINVGGVPSTRTAATNVNGGRVNLNVDNGLGTGQINVNAAGYLNVGAAQATLDVHVGEFGALGGTLTGAAYGGNVTLAAQNAVIVDNASVLPTTTQTGGAVHLLGLTSNATPDLTVGDDGNPATTDDVFKGVAVGLFTNNGAGGDFGGPNAVSEAQPGQGITLYMMAPKRFGGTAGTATFTTTNATTGLNVLGPGTMELNEPDPAGITRAISTDLITRDGFAPQQNHTILRFTDTSSLGTGQTVNVFNGRVDLDHDAGVQDGAVVNINDGATLSLDRNATSGTFRINAGGALAVFNVAHVNAGATFEVAGADALLILDADLAVAEGTALDAQIRQSNLVPHDGDADTFTGLGIVLGDGKRLTTPANGSVDLADGGAGVTAAAGATSVIFSASSGDTLDVNDTVTFGTGVRLLVGDDDATNNPFTTIQGADTGTQRFNRIAAPQTGTVRLDGPATALGPVTVRSGTLDFGDAAADAATVAGDVTVAGGTFAYANGTLAVSGEVVLSGAGTNAFFNDTAAGLAPSVKDGTLAAGGRGVVIGDGAYVEFEYDQTTAPLTVNQRFWVGGNAANSSGRQFVVDRDSTITGGVNTVLVPNVALADGAVLGVDVQDIGATDVRLGVRLAGTATAAEQTLTGADQDEFSFLDISGANADGSPNTTDPRTLNLGQTPAGTTPGTTGAPNGTGYIFNTHVYGTVASNVTLNAINGQTDFQNGSALDGTYNVYTRTGDFYIRIRAGSDGNPANRLAGAGVINHGNLTGTVFEDVAGFVDEVDVGATPDPSLAPLYNATDVRVNVLNLAAQGGGNRAILRAERGFDANGAQDISGLFEFGNVHVEDGAVLQLEANNGQSVKVSLVLDGGNATVTSGNTGTQAFVGDVTDPGPGDTLTFTGGNAVRLIGTASARRLVVGGPDTGNNSGSLILQRSDAQTQVVNSVAYPLVPGPLTSAVLNLTEYLEVNQGGNVDVGINNVSNGDFSITSGLRLAGNGDVDLFAPFTVGAGQRLTGTSSTVIDIFTNGTNTGSLTIAAGGTLAPGDSAGTLRVNNGPINLADGAAYAYEAGATTATSDQVIMTGTDGAPAFAGDWTLLVSALGVVDPNGRTFVLFDNAVAPAGVGTPTIAFAPGLGWSGGTVQIVGNDVVLTDVVPEPAAASIMAVGAVGLLARRRRRW